MTSSIICRIATVHPRLVLRSAFAHDCMWRLLTDDFESKSDAKTDLGLRCLGARLRWCRRRRPPRNIATDVEVRMFTDGGKEAGA
jgi:hypothetical protein